MDHNDDFVMLDCDDLKDFNEANILPESKVTLEQIKKWLQPTAYDLDGSEYRKHLVSHTKGTGLWLTDTNAYKQWHDGTTHGTLWLKGIPGSGKSVFAASLTDQFERERVPVLYFFFRQIIDANHEPRALLQDWLVQILPFSPPLQVQLAKGIEIGRKLTSLSMDDLWRHLREALSHQQRVYCVADALDEVDRGHDIFLGQLASLGLWKPANIKILMTSRPVPAVEVPLRNIETLDLRLEERLVDKDIAVYVDSRLANTAISVEHRHAIKNAVPGRANGLFLYAKLAMDAFTESNANVPDALARLPMDINAMYTNLLREHARRSNIPGDTQLHVLTWTTHAIRPLRLIEISEMLSVVEPTAEAIDLKSAKNLVRAACGPLLEILRDESISVVHHSLTEFLKGSTRLSTIDNTAIDFYPVLDPGTSHKRLAMACLRYLRSIYLKQHEYPGRNGNDANDNSDQTSESQLRMQYPFLDYAANNWYIHAAKASVDLEGMAEIYDEMDVLATDRSQFEAWLVFAWPNSSIAKVTVLHMSAWTGLSGYIERILRRDHGDIDLGDGTLQTPLHWAATQGHRDAAAVLLAYGALPDAEDKSGLKPLHKAATHGHAGVAKLLLEAGVSPLTIKTKETGIRRCGNAPRTVGHTPLMYACQNGHADVVRECLAYLENIDDVHHALIWAAGGAQSKVVKVILDHPGTMVDGKWAGDSALFHSCKRHDIVSMEYLLQAGADPNLLCNFSEDEFAGWRGKRALRNRDITNKANWRQGYTPVHAFCGLGVRRSSSTFSNADNIQAGFRMLQDAGARFDGPDQQGKTPLHYATRLSCSGDGSIQLVQLLLDVGTDPNALDADGMSPAFGCRADTVGVVDLLIERGADIDVGCGTDGKSLLLTLLASHHPESAVKLLKYEPDLNVVDSAGNGVLHIACSSRRPSPEIITALVEAGADLNVRNKQGETPLLSIEHGMLDHLPILINSGADLEARDSKGCTLVSKVLDTRGGDWKEELVKLLELGACSLTKDSHGRSLLFQAVERGDDLNRLSHLHDLGLHVRDVDFDGNTLFHELAMRWSKNNDHDLDILKLLLDWGVNPKEANHEGRTALHSFVASGPRKETRVNITEVLEALISITSDVNARDHIGVTPLHIAATVSEIFAAHLLRSGADPTIQSHEGLTALHLAARARQSNTVGVLLQHSAGQAIDWSTQRSVDPFRVASSPCPFIDLRDNNGRTALHHACRSGRSETVALLLRAGADPYIVDQRGRTALVACAEFQHEEQLWSQSGGYANTGEQTHAAGLRLLDQCRPSVVRRYRRLDLDFDIKHRQPYRSTEDLSIGINEIVEMLLAHGDEYEIEGHYSTQALHSAYSEAIDVGAQHTFEAFRPLLQRLRGAEQFSYTHSRFDEDVLDWHTDGAEHVLSGLLTAGRCQADGRLFSTILRMRRHDLIEALYDGGVSFVEPVDHHGSHLHTLARYGLASLLKKVCSTADVEEINDTEHNTHMLPGRSDQKAKPLLSTACAREQPNLPAIKVLVEEHNADVDARSYDHVYRNGYEWAFGEGPLHVLAASQHWWQVEQALPYLLKSGSANTEIRNARNETPLHVAIGDRDSSPGYYHQAAIRHLIAAGADVNAVDGQGRSCLARVERDVGLVRFLIRSGAIIGPEAVFAAVETQDLELLEVYLSEGGDPNQRRAAKQARIVGPSRESRQGPIEYDQWYPLHYAMAYCVPPGVRGDRPANTATFRPTALPVISMLLRHGADPLNTFEIRTDKQAPRKDSAIGENDDFDDDEGGELVSEYSEETILHYAIGSGQVIDPVLLEMPQLDVERRDWHGRTLLHAACLSHFGPDAAIATPLSNKDIGEVEGPSILQTILDLGADVKAVDKEGKNALHYIAESGRRYETSAATLLSKCPELLSQADKAGNTPLHAALRHFVRTPLVEQMLRTKTVQPLQADSDGNSALHRLSCFLAAEPSEDARIVAQELFTKFKGLGVDIGARNNVGDTTLHSHARHGDFLSTWSKRWGYMTASHAEADTVVPNEGFKFLLAQGANLFARNNAGETVMHLLAAKSISNGIHSYGEGSRSRLSRLFRWLIQLGLDPMAEDARQRTCIDVAAANRNEAVLKLFERDGEK